MRYLGGGIGHKALHTVVKIIDTIKLLVKQGFSINRSSDASTSKLFVVVLEH